MITCFSCCQKLVNAKINFSNGMAIVKYGLKFQRKPLESFNAKLKNMNESFAILHQKWRRNSNAFKIYTEKNASVDSKGCATKY